MHGPPLAIMPLVAVLGLVTPSSIAGTTDAVAVARRKLATEDGIAAVAILEEALPGASAGKDSVLTLLQQAYEVAAKQADGAGHPREAETYRENLKILNRKSRPARTQLAGPEPIPVATIPTPERKAEAQPVLPGPSPGPILLPEGPSPQPSNLPPGPELADPSVAEMPRLGKEPPSAEPSRESTIDPSALLRSPVDPLFTEISNADAAFSSKDYREAGRIYSALAQNRQLPPERREHWLYCRATEVVSRINAHPSTRTEWAGIVAEIDQIRAVDPKFYLGEYLRDLAAERQSGRTKMKPTNTMVVRGSAPEEPPLKDRPVRPASNPIPPQADRPSTALTSNSSPSAARIGTSVGRWQILDSTNFRIFHADPALAAKVAKAAESARLEHSKRWGSPTSRGTWSPLCEIYLYPSAPQYAQMTGQPEDSPGFSTMGMNAGRIISRRVNLRTDHPALVQAVLPHEITHVILADFFTEQQIPRWADEGLAVLAEPADEQERRAADLVGPLAANRLFAVDVLMSMDYPDNRYWTLYYAQSVSLTRFLVEQGTPDQMLQFLRTAQREGYEVGLRRIYQIDGYRDLQNRWMAYARSHAQAPATATAPANGPDLKIR